MRFLQTAVRGTGFILVLTDEDGIVLDFCGDAEILASAKENNYVPGCRHAEELVGTNAIGLDISQRADRRRRCDIGATTEQLPVAQFLVDFARREKPLPCPKTLLKFNAAAHAYPLPNRS